MKRNHRQQAIINALALVAVLACGYITVTDSMMTVFGQSQGVQYLFNIIYLVAVLACGYITVTDSMMTVFGQSQGVQYLFNIIYLVAVLPTAIAVSDLFERLHPELSEENETNA